MYLSFHKQQNNSELVSMFREIFIQEFYVLGKSFILLVSLFSSTTITLFSFFTQDQSLVSDRSPVLPKGDNYILSGKEFRKSKEKPR